MVFFLSQQTNHVQQTNCNFVDVQIYHSNALRTNISINELPIQITTTIWLHILSIPSRKYDQIIKNQSRKNNVTAVAELPHTNVAKSN